jgi:uncharacterized protein (DUF924 family)
MSTVTLPPEAATLLAFWFGTAEVAGPVDPANMGRWFRTDAAFDAACKDNFGALADRAARGDLTDWETSAPGALARVILLDQIPRNLYRDDARTFAADPQAVEVAARAIARGFDREVSTLARMFFYLPFEHAEDMAHQDRCVALSEQAVAEAPPELASLSANLVDYAVKHRAVIARFGRFPHRNAALGRESTPDEREFLASGRGF